MHVCTLFERGGHSQPRIPMGPQFFERFNIGMAVLNMMLQLQLLVPQPGCSCPVSMQGSLLRRAILQPRGPLLGHRQCQKADLS